MLLSGAIDRYAALSLTRCAYENPEASGIGLEIRGVAVDPGHHLVVQSQYGSRLSGTQSEQLKLPPELAIPRDFSLADIDSFSKQASALRIKTPATGSSLATWHTLEVLAEQAARIGESGVWVWPTGVAGYDA